MIPSQHSRALKIICRKAEETEVVWAVTGSLGFALHGMEIEVGDIDLQTDAAGAYEIESAFSGNVIRGVKLSVSEKGCFRTTCVSLNGIRQ